MVLLLVCFYFTSLSKTNFPTTAANTPPTIGPTIKTQSCDNASPPAKIAGAILLAGLTDVPVNGIPSK